MTVNNKVPPAVSVIVPNYNHARFLRKRIETILAQTHQDFELILLDDCSTDESRSILREYESDPRVRLEFNEVNSGSTFKQWNKGVRLARGKYVWIAESDDYADERFLERLTAVLESDPRIMFAYCRSRRVSADDRFYGYGDYYLARLDPRRWLADFCMDGHEVCEKYFARLNPVANASAVLFRKGVYDQVGGADENMRLCGDWKLWAAMALAGKVAYVSEPLSYYRFHRSSVRNQTELNGTHIPEDLQLCRWMLDHVTVPEAVLEEICSKRAGLWVPALMSFRVPLALKRTILRHVVALDPHPLRRVLRPALITVRLKVRRHWRELRSMITPPRTSP